MSSIVELWDPSSGIIHLRDHGDEPVASWCGVSLEDLTESQSDPGDAPSNGSEVCDYCGKCAIDQLLAIPEHPPGQIITNRSDIVFLAGMIYGSATGQRSVLDTVATWIAGTQTS